MANPADFHSKVFEQFPLLKRLSPESTILTNDQKTQFITVLGASTLLFVGSIICCCKVKSCASRVTLMTASMVGLIAMVASYTLLGSTFYPGNN